MAHETILATFILLMAVATHAVWRGALPIICMWVVVRQQTPRVVLNERKGKNNKTSVYIYTICHYYYQLLLILKCVCVCLLLFLISAHMRYNPDGGS